MDDMDLERERGITIKAHAVKLNYKAKDGQEYVFNLIDTPGHVDFNYEVSRSLAACEGAILIVDASQGVEAQTLANTYLALDHDLDILPVINKIDLPAAEPERVAEEVEDVIGIPCMDAPRISAKTGENVEEVLEYIVKGIKPPVGNDNKPLKALIFDSVYDSYRGVIVYVRIKEGKIKAGDTMKIMSTGAEFTVVEVGYMRATYMEKADELSAGEVGYITASIKTVGDAHVGDTVTTADNPAAEALPGYRKVNPMVYCGLYPADGSDYEVLRDALEKLQLNDASLSYEPETSGALGFGFRCGFLGLLHLEIIQERLDREYNLDLIATVPSVVYKIYLTDGTMVEIDNPTNYPDPAYIDYCEEPFADAHIYVPSEFVGTVMDMCQDKRGIFKNVSNLVSSTLDTVYQTDEGESRQLAYKNNVFYTDELDNLSGKLTDINQKKRDGFTYRYNVNNAECENMSVNVAVSRDVYQVNFYTDETKTERISYAFIRRGSSAVAPATPEAPTCKKFVSWSEDYSNVLCDLDVYAVWEDDHNIVKSFNSESGDIDIHCTKCDTVNYKFNFLETCNKRKGEDGFNELADINNDGVVNAKDYAIFTMM